VRIPALIVGLVIASGAQAQEAKKKPAAKKKQVAHTKATPEQIRKFNEMQKKQAK